MSWPTPSTGPWNPGIPPPMPLPSMNMNMGSYTPQQWAAMQQNWGQWAQWQQQYAQWQSQYGNEYAQQMQAIQQMGGMIPPPPIQVAPPVPPPPEKPPPPPHENNQPLFGNIPPQGSLLPTPVPAPPQSQQNKHNYNNTTVPIGNNQNWSNLPEKRPENQLTVNENALKKLAEEEKLFDIQFKKWEEEIGQWRKDNANHPDKQAYKEYEEKFETCRAQLLERRKQMKQKRDALLGIAQPGNKATTSNPIVTGTPTATQNTSINYNKNAPLNNYKSSYASEEKVSQLNNYSRTSQSHGVRDNKNVDPQDRYESYQNINNKYTPPSNSDNTNFLEKKTAGIPGLDLLPDTDKVFTKNTDVIDITDDQPNNLRQQKPNLHGPDYTTISKGIDNILGDEKIMNILTMVKGQNSASGPNIPDNQNNNMNYNNDYSGQSMDSQNQHQNNQWNRNDNNYNNQQNKNNVQVVRSGYSMQQDQQSTFLNQQRRINDNGPGPGNVPLENRNPQKMLMGRQQPQPLMPQNILPSQQRRMNESGSGIMQQENRNPPNLLLGRQQPQPLMSQNIAPPRPIQQNTPQDYGDFNRGPNDNKILGESNISNIPPTPPQPQKPKWVDEPMFTPYIIVEYDHKPLRLKARDFIEPVHVFDYDHKSKEEDSKKKDFEEEVDQLFSRLPRKDKNDEERYGREPPRDYVRRGPKDTRDDYYPRGNSRSEYAERRRPDRYDDRRRDERDRYKTEYPLRERESYRGERDSPRERERDFTRERERDLTRDRERDFTRDRERDFTRDRERDFTRDRDRGSYRDREREFSRDREREPARNREKELTRDRDKASGRDKEKESLKDRASRDRFGRDVKREERERSAWSQDTDSRKRGLSKESDLSDHSASKKSREIPFKQPGQVPHIMIDDLLEPPGRDMRPEKIAIILRGPPGSGKSYLAKLIRDREAEYDGTARIMSIDDYFMQESTVEEKDPVTGKITQKPIMKYEYDITMEESYLASLRKSFKRSLSNGYFTFLIFDAVNDQLKHYADIWNTARQHGFQVYVCTMELDPQICFKRNIHNRTLEDIQVICCRFFETPAHHLQLDPTTLLQNAAIQNVDMEDAVMDESDNEVLVNDLAAEVENSFTSKWEKMDDADKLARLDGTSKPLRPSQLSMEDYLQLDDWKPAAAQPGKKTVRWADIEETREQEKMRAIGFVVGQTDWNRMTDPTMGSSALTQTKYIERVRRH